MSKIKGLADIRREYGALELDEADIHACPMVQFERWFIDALNTEQVDPNAMVLSTVDKEGHPDSRIVLLKGIEDAAFVFYTNYNSTKSVQIKANSSVALNFYWPTRARQVRVRGQIKQTSNQQSDDYFYSRPMHSQLSSIASPQSAVINRREDLEQVVNELIALHHDDKSIVRPKHWGGYMVIPDEIEFFQGRDSRLHDRIHYYYKSGQWNHRRLAP